MRTGACVFLVALITASVGQARPNHPTPRQLIQQEMLAKVGRGDVLAARKALAEFARMKPPPRIRPLPKIK